MGGSTERAVQQIVFSDLLAKVRYILSHREGYGKARNNRRSHPYSVEAIAVGMLDLLIVNPNSSKSMTDELERTVSEHFNAKESNCKLTYFTGPPSSPPQIDGIEASLKSCKECLPLLTDSDSIFYYEKYDGILIGCFSDHPLVDKISSLPKSPLVMGLLNSCINFVSLFPDVNKPFSIITSNKEWVDILNDSVNKKFINKDLIDKKTWQGTVATNLQVLDLHKKENFDKIVKIIKRENVDALNSKYVILGCAGFSGLQYKLNKIFEDEDVFFIDSIVLAIKALYSYASYIDSELVSSK